MPTQGAWCDRMLKILPRVAEQRRMWLSVETDYELLEQTRGPSAQRPGLIFISVWALRTSGAPPYSTTRVPRTLPGRTAPSILPTRSPNCSTNLRPGCAWARSARGTRAGPPVAFALGLLAVGGVHESGQ